MNASKYTVLQLGKFFFPESGGIETITKLVVEGLQNEWQTDVLCFSRNSKTTSRMFGASKIIECGHFLFIASTPVSFSFFHNYFKIRNKYDIIHVHVPNPLAVLAVLLFKPKGKVVVQYHSDILNQKAFYKLFRFFERRFLRNADLILATSPNYIKHSKPLQPELHKVHSLPLSIDTKELPADQQLVAEIRRKYANKTIIFSLGRFVYYKGFEYLIEAATFLNDQYIVLIGGRGKLKQYYLDLIQQHQLENKVFIIDSILQEELGSYYQACDIFCLPSCEKTEAFGVVLLEAMSFSKPIVAVNIPGSGVSWVNQHLQTGLNVSGRNAVQLAEAIRQTTTYDNLETFSKNSYERFTNHFSKEKMIAQLINLYQRAMETDFK